MKHTIRQLFFFFSPQLFLYNWEFPIVCEKNENLF